VFCKSCDELGLYRCPKHGLKERTAEATKGVRTRLKESERQNIRQARWSGVRDAFLLWQQRMRQEHWCEKCGRICPSEYLELDHIQSRARGGEDVAGNAQLLCRSCHREKHGEPQWSSAQ
jgi:5-methylcytosine-specific restriction endonuclease McrA